MRKHLVNLTRVYTLATNLALYIYFNMFCLVVVRLKHYVLLYFCMGRLDPFLCVRCIKGDFPEVYYRAGRLRARCFNLF